MDRILPARRDWPLHDVAGSRQLEQQAAAGLAPHTLMQRAGRAVASLARALRPHGQSVWIACGPGNNGGDGLEAAMHLREAGWDVQVTLAADPTRLPADAGASLARARAAGVAISAALPDGATPDLSIDALLGIGGTRAPGGSLAACIGRLNALPAPVLAVDLPSGLNADTGQPHGEICVNAQHTLSLLTLKPGLFTAAGRDLAGDIWLDTLGAPTQAAHPLATLVGQAQLVAPRRHAHHKGSYGDVAVVGGAPGMAGAVLLAARAAHAAGAGRVYACALDASAPALDASRPELMLRPGWWRDTSPEQMTQATVVAGCGGADAIRAALPRLLSHAGRLVLDADGLNAIATDDNLRQLLKSRQARGRETILTPHPLEAARLLGVTTAEVQADRLAAAQRISETTGSVVVLKGSGSIVAAPGLPASVNGTGNAALASPGTGDVLAGWIGGCWSSTGASAEQVARHAVWLHGDAAERSRVAPLRALDLIEAMLAATGG